MRRRFFKCNPPPFLKKKKFWGFSSGELIKIKAENKNRRHFTGSCHLFCTKKIPPYSTCMPSYTKSLLKYQALPINSINVLHLAWRSLTKICLKIMINDINLFRQEVDIRLVHVQKGFHHMPCPNEESVKI